MSKFPLETIRHSAAHIMAYAVRELYKNVKFDIGPSTADGFYYDFDMEDRISVEDFPKIEAKMEELVKSKIPFERIEVTRAEAEKIFSEKGQTYKLERLADIPEGETVSLYKCGDFTDLCRGPHVDNSIRISAFKLLSVAGSYYRGDEKNKMLKRV